MHWCFLKWWYPPQNTPKMMIFSRKAHGFVGETHHFRNPPHLPIIEFSGDFFRSFLGVLFDLVKSWKEKLSTRTIKALNSLCTSERHSISREAIFSLRPKFQACHVFFIHRGLCRFGAHHCDCEQESGSHGRGGGHGRRRMKVCKITSFLQEQVYICFLKKQTSKIRECSSPYFS